MTFRHKKLGILLISTGFTLPAQAEQQELFELDPIVVTAPPQQQSEQTLPAIVLTTDELSMKTGHTIGDTLKNELGISSQSFGPGVGTPVIRGQTGSRVRLLNNGLGSNDVSAISPDHASSIEPLLAKRIEVLRGPSTLLYSSGAMGGVVNVVDNRIPDNTLDKPIAAALQQRFDSSSNETSTTMKIDGTNHQMAYHLDGFYRHRNNLNIGGHAIDPTKTAITDPSLTIYDNPEGFLNNTGAEAISGSAGLSWIDDFGYAGLSINNLNNNYGIAPDGTGEETVRIALRQNKYDFKSEWQHPFWLAKMLRTRLGYTDYQHTEIANGEPGAFFSNKTYESRLELDHKDMGPLRGTLGFQAQSSDFNAIEKLTGTNIVPRSDIYSYAAFGMESFDIGSVTYQLGSRIEKTAIETDNGYDLGYTPISASASAQWNLNLRNNFSLSLTRSARAPNVQELLANGYHDSTRSYEQGSLNLKEEIAYNLDLGYHYHGDSLRAELNLFHNWAGDYIYQSHTGIFVDKDGNPCLVDCKPLLISSQANALFKGYEAKLIFPILETPAGLLELTLFSDYTRGEFQSGENVPRMPPLRYGMQLDYTVAKLSSYLRFTRADEQRHSGQFETTTDGYLLLNTGIHYPLQTGKDHKMMLFAKGNNLLNENIRNSTSYLRNFAAEPGRGAEIGIDWSF